jgi:uncharacterized lipoprotein YddW (UPF0748 family)
MWMWGSTLSSQGSKTVVSKLKENYVNRIYLLVKGTGGTRTSASLLTEFINDAHAEGIEVHLWYIVADDNVYVADHPDAHQYHAPRPGTNDNAYPNTDSKVNLLYPGYKEYVLEGIKYFLDNFDCDGIHLDVIRYGHLVYSFDPQHLQKAESLGCNTERILQLFRDNYNYYANGTGFMNLYAIGDSDIVKWVNMRKDIIHDYISAIRDLIDSVKPNVELNAAFMPEGAYESPTVADIHYGQSYSLNAPLMDEIVPMAYFNSFGGETSWMRTVAEGAIKKVTSNCRIANGFQTFDGVTAKQVREQIQYSLAGGAKGVVGFRYGTTTADHWAVIKEEYRKLYEASPKTITNSGMLEVCKTVCDSLASTLTIPGSVQLDTIDTVTASDFYYMMVNYLRHYSNHNNTPPDDIAIIKDIAVPDSMSGAEPGSQVGIDDILAAGKDDAAYIDAKRKIPNSVTAGTTEYDPAVMFSLYARVINYFGTNGTMPGNMEALACIAPEDWTYRDSILGDNELTGTRMLSICGEVCDQMTASPVVPKQVFTDTGKTKFVSAADFYSMMANYLHLYVENDSTAPKKINIVRNISGPANIAGVQTENPIMLNDLLTICTTDAEFIDANKRVPDFTKVDTVDYDPAAMFWVYARTINWYRNNGTMPNYATVRACTGPETWTYGDTITSVENNFDNLPGNFVLYQNYPNPFNPSTEIGFQLLKSGLVTLKVYDMLGREVAVLINKEISEGYHSVNFNAVNLSSGLYLYQLSAGNFTSVKKMVLLK